jgi:hypothetical protein
MDNIPDPFDPNLLRLDQMFVEGVPIKKYLSTIPVRKPGRQEFVRVNSNEEWRLTPAAILELKEDRELYLVRPHLVHVLCDEVWPATIFTAITRQGTLFLWPVRLPTPQRLAPFGLGRRRAGQEQMAAYYRQFEPWRL